MNIGESAKFRGGVSADTISELTSASGVTIDGVLLKDANITASGTGSNSLSGNTGIGGSPYSTTKLRATGSPGTGASVYGIYSDPVFSATATGSCSSVVSTPSLEAASFNMANMYQFRAYGASLGAGATISNQYGFFADTSLTSASGTNYGFCSNIAASGTARYNFYANGTAPNFFGGLVRCGATATTDVALSTAVAAKLRSGSETYTDNVTAASGTVSHGTVVSFDNPAIAATNASVTYTTASTLYIDGAPTAGSNVTVTNAYALYVAGGLCYFGGNLGLGVGPSSTTKHGIGGTYTGSATMIGSYVGGTLADDVSGFQCFRCNPYIAASALVETVSGFWADGITLNAAASGTTQYGFIANSTITSATTNYGFYSDIAASGTARYNFFANGTAPNVFKGAITTPRTTLTASATGSGAITVINNYHAVSGAGGAASTITTINGGIDGMMVVLKAVSDTVDISFATGGNILLDGGATFTCDTLSDTITLIYDGSLTKWLEIGRCNNS